MRKHLTYANVAATLALVFAMTGGALAAKHYLINSTKQINPKVLKKLRGKAGPRGAARVRGRAGQRRPAGQTGAPKANAAPTPEAISGSGGERRLRPPAKRLRSITEVDTAARQHTRCSQARSRENSSAAPDEAGLRAPGQHATRSTDRTLTAAAKETALHRPAGGAAHRHGAERRGWTWHANRKTRRKARFVNRPAHRQEGIDAARRREPPSSTNREFARRASGV